MVGDTPGSVDRDGILRLDGLTPVGTGSRQDVFVLPQDPGTIVKVDRTDFVRIRGGMIRHLKRKFLPPSDHRPKFAEAREAMRLTLLLQGTRMPSPVAEFRGFVRTDRGLGTRHAHIRDADGSTARQVATLPGVETGTLEPDWVDAIEDLLRRFLDTGTIVNDLNPGNVVMSRGEGRFLCTLIDGYGDRAVVPLRRAMPALNTRKVHRQIASFSRRIGGRWDADACRLRMPAPSAQER